MNADAREVARHQEFVQFDGAGDGLHEDDDLGRGIYIKPGREHVTYLIEFEAVEQLVQLPVLANFFQLDVVLLQPVESEFGLVVDEDFERLFEESVMRIVARLAQPTLLINFLQVARISLARVALNIITCL